MDIILWYLWYIIVDFFESLIVLVCVMGSSLYQTLRGFFSRPDDGVDELVEMMDMMNIDDDPSASPDYLQPKEDSPRSMRPDSLWASSPDALDIGNRVAEMIKDPTSNGDPETIHLVDQGIRRRIPPNAQESDVTTTQPTIISIPTIQKLCKLENGPLLDQDVISKAPISTQPTLINQSTTSEGKNVSNKEPQVNQTDYDNCTLCMLICTEYFICGLCN